MKKILLFSLLFFGCKSDNDLINEIKTSNCYMFNRTIEEYVNLIAGVGGHVNWLLVEEKNVTSNDLVMLEADVTRYNQFTNQNAECVFRFVYNKSTKQNQLWYWKEGDKVLISEGVDVKDQYLFSPSEEKKEVREDKPTVTSDETAEPDSTDVYEDKNDTVGLITPVNHN